MISKERVSELRDILSRKVESHRQQASHWKAAFKKMHEEVAQDYADLLEIVDAYAPGPSPEDMEAETAIGLVAHLVGFYAESQQGWMLQKSDLKELVPTLRRLISPSSNGRTPDFQSGGEGSIPSGDASPEDREAVDAYCETIADKDHKALAHIRRLRMEEGKS